MEEILEVTAEVTAGTEAPIDKPLLLRWKPAGKALALAFGLRIFYSLLAALVSPFLSLDPKQIGQNRLTGQLMSRGSNALLYALTGVWQRFDALWYVRIARHGYNDPVPTVFYPLYPGLIRATSFITHSDLVSALLISTVASFFLFWGALRLFELDHTPAVAFRALLLWVAWPGAFAFFAGYPDSLLCAFTVWSLYLARSGRWLTAGVSGFFAGCTKALGCFTALPLLWIAWRQRSWKGLFAAALCGAGTAGLEGWLMIKHFPSLAQTYRIYWGTTTVAPWTSVGDAVWALAHGGDQLLWLEFGVLAVIAATAFMRRVSFEYRIYTVAAICLFLTKHSEPLLQSTVRYLLVVFPAYPALSVRLKRGLPFASVLLIAACVNLSLFLAFLDWRLVI
jgi:hypothetical protein